jgi:hypothetical protein
LKLNKNLKIYLNEYALGHMHTIYTIDDELKYMHFGAYSMVSVCSACGPRPTFAFPKTKWVKYLYDFK